MIASNETQRRRGLLSLDASYMLIWIANGGRQHAGLWNPSSTLRHLNLTEFQCVWTLYDHRVMSKHWPANSGDWCWCSDEVMASLAFRRERKHQVILWGRRAGMLTGRGWHSRHRSVSVVNGMDAVWQQVCQLRLTVHAVKRKSMTKHHRPTCTATGSRPEHCRGAGPMIGLDKPIQ